MAMLSVRRLVDFSAVISGSRTWAHVLPISSNRQCSGTACLFSRPKAFLRVVVDYRLRGNDGCRSVNGVIMNVEKLVRFARRAIFAATVTTIAATAISSFAQESTAPADGLQRLLFGRKIYEP